MALRLEFGCDGCDATAKATGLLTNDRNWTPAGYMGGVEMAKVTDEGLRSAVERITPEGWVAFDPYTCCTYCPECWAGIEGDIATRDPRPKDTQATPTTAEGESINHNPPESSNPEGEK